MNTQSIGPHTPGLPVASFLQSLHDRFRSLSDGEPASYIPPLAEADPSWFGISLVTTDGHSYEVGDTRRPFTIQSISKAFTFGMALEDRGPDVVIEHVGVEPTGDPFNSISVEEDTKRPYNPMVNAGAIVTTSLLSGATPDEQWSRLLAGLSRFAGRPLGIDERVFRAEQRSGDRNRAIAYFMRALDMGPSDVEAALDLYFRQCSVLVDCSDLAMMAATLANRGVHPVTGERAMDEDQVVRVLSVMSTCGMYDFTGEWVYRVGIPAKSGVSGGIIAVVPGQLGIGVYSPPLDRRGNSVRGVEVCEQLSRRFGLHGHRTQLSGSSVVRSRYTGAAVRSRRDRGPKAADMLREAGAGIVVFELQGDLFFATAEALSRAVAGTLDTARFLILDFRRAGHVDAGALDVLGDLVELVRARRVDLVFAELPSTLQSIETVPASVAAVRRYPDLDGALEWCEEGILAELAEPVVPLETNLADQELLAGLTPAMLDVVAARTERRVFAPGATVFCEGDPAEELFFVLSGRVSVHLSVGEHSRRLAALSPGSAFGEMALLDEGRRSSAIVADEETVCQVLTRDALAALDGDEFPGIASIIYRNLARSLSRRLRDTNETVRSLE